MAIVLTDDKHYKNIANKVREIKNTNETMTPHEMPDKIDEVYLTGANLGNLVEESAKGFLNVPYINPNKHKIEVKLSSDTITDFSGVEVKVLGANLYDISKVNGAAQSNTTTPDVAGHTQYGTVTDGVLHLKWALYDRGIIWTGSKFPVKQNSDYYVSADIFIDSSIVTTATDIVVAFRNITKQATTPISKIVATDVRDTWLKYNFPKIVVPDNWVGDDVYLMLQASGSSEQYFNIPIYAKNIMISYREPKPYEPYTEIATYIAKANGTVEIPHSAPSINLTTDKGIVITCKSYKANDYDWHNFWNDFQDYGNRTSYLHAFRGWTDIMFKPKYNITLTGDASGMFNGATITNLKQRLQDCGVVLDMFGTTTMNALFQNSKITHLPTIDTRSCNSFSYTFYNMIVLKEFEKLILKEDGSQKLTASPFGNLHNLEKIVIEGKLGSTVTFAQSKKLNHDSIISVVNALSTTTTGTTITFSLEAVKNAFETSEGMADGNTSAEWLALVATRSNWTISLV